MNMTRFGSTLQVSIERSLEQAYAFLAPPENFPKWASGLARGLRREQERWIVEAPQGSLEASFSERNPYGILDHWLKLPSGQELYIPLRVVANGAGCEVLLTLFRAESASDEEYARDQDWVRRDLQALKSLLEDT